MPRFADGSAPPQSFRNKLADLPGEKPVGGLDSRVFLVLNKQSGNWGAAVGGTQDNDVVLTVKAFTSCVSKDTGIPLSHLRLPKEIQAHNRNDACKLVAVKPPRSLALFRNKLGNGQYEFHGAFSETDSVPQSEYDKQYNDCKTSGTGCRVIRTFGPQDAGRVF